MCSTVGFSCGFSLVHTLFSLWKRLRQVFELVFFSCFHLFLLLFASCLPMCLHHSPCPCVFENISNFFVYAIFRFFLLFSIFTMCRIFPQLFHLFNVFLICFLHVPHFIYFSAVSPVSSLPDFLTVSVVLLSVFFEFFSRFTLFPFLPFRIVLHCYIFPPFLTLSHPFLLFFNWEKKGPVFARWQSQTYKICWAEIQGGAQLNNFLGYGPKRLIYLTLPHSKHHTTCSPRPNEKHSKRKPALQNIAQNKWDITNFSILKSCRSKKRVAK